MFVKQWFIDFKNYFIFSIENLNLSSYISWLPSPNKAWCYTKHFVCIDLVLDGMTSENKFQKCDINNVLLLPVEMGNSKRWSVRSWKIREAIESWTGPFREIKKPNAQLNAGPLSSMIYGHTLYSPPCVICTPPLWRTMVLLQHVMYTIRLLKSLQNQFQHWKGNTKHEMQNTKHTNKSVCHQKQEFYAIPLQHIQRTITISCTLKMAYDDIWD